MKEERWNRAAREVARAVVEVIPDLNEDKIATRVYGYFAGEHSPTRGGGFDDTFFYYTDDIREIMETAFDKTVEGNADSLVAASDIKWAFSNLSDNYQYRLMERYRYGIIRDHDSRERAELNRAVAKLCDILNGWNRTAGYEGPGSRQLYSNARAAAEIDRNY